MVTKWPLIYFVWKGGLSRAGTKLGALTGGRWANVKEVLLDASLALGLSAIWIFLKRVMDRWLGPGHAASIQTLLPQRVAETSPGRKFSEGLAPDKPGNGCAPIFPVGGFR